MTGKSVNRDAPAPVCVPRQYFVTADKRRKAEKRSTFARRASLYATIEVKTTLTQDELKRAYKSAGTLRTLRPFKHAFVGSGGAAERAGREACRCMYVVFTFETDLSEDDWASKELDRATIAASTAGASVDCVDRIVVLNRGLLSPGERLAKTDDQATENMFFDFFLHLVNFIARETRRRPPVDYQVYARRTSKGWKRIP